MHGLQSIGFRNKRAQVRHLPLKELADQIRQDGGATVRVLNTRFHDMKGADKWAVSLPGYEYIVDIQDLNADLLERYILDNYEVLTEPAKYGPVALGAWINGSKLYLDISVLIQVEEEAVKVGRQNGQLAIYHLATGEQLDL